MVVWAAVLLMIALVAAGAWGWHLSRLQVAVTSRAEQWPLLRPALFVAAGVGMVILALGAVAFVLTGYNWLILAAIWPVGLLHLGLLTRTVRKARKETARPGPAR